MTAKRKTRAPKQTGKDILQFAPNFTAYVLPPATVCLYSEHRKFFLHGELYCAIAEAIGKNGKSAQLLMRDLSKKYPLDQIQEGLKRLFDRRYIAQASPSTTGVVAGFWASLGLPPEVAEKNLADCRVRVEAFDVKGAKELTAALTHLGVRVVNRSGDLTVTLVNDYLDRRLAEQNKQHVADKTPWLLVQPSGRLPAGGPGLQPRRERMLDLPVRPHDPQPGDQGIPGSRAGADGRGVAAGAEHVRTERDPVRGRRNREGDRVRLPHGLWAITSQASI